MPVPSLATDLYQLTMMAGYFRTGRHRLRATFELFTRRLPPNRACLVFAGLEQAIDYLEHLRFTRGVGLARSAAGVLDHRAGVLPVSRDLPVYR